jgi:hypothetical protein
MNLEDYINIQENEKRKTMENRMTLLKQDQHRRCYKLDRKVVKDRYGKPIQPTDVIVVSDSIFHRERLVFAAYTKSTTTLKDLKHMPIIECLHLELQEIAGISLPLDYDDENSEYVKADLEYYEDLHFE